jgi:hypothetical protein
MYYLDARFKDCVKLPAPDSPRRQRAELISQRAASDWDGFVAAPAAGSPTPAMPTTVPGPEVSQAELSTPGGGDAGDVSHAKLDPVAPLGAFPAFFADEQPGAAAAAPPQPDHPAAGAGGDEELPL